jgi:hypothetical protein
MDALNRISRRFEDAESKQLELSARQFSPFTMEYWAEKAKEREDYWETQKQTKKQKRA